MLKLMREEVSYQDLEVISESIDSEKTFRIKGPYIQCEVLNGNGRVYPKPIGKREVDRYIKEEVSRRNSLGEFQHPARATIDRERACILIENLIEDGNNFMGEAKVLKKFPMGRLVHNLLEEKIPVGVSSRGLGSVDGNTKRVNEDFKLICIDVVDRPSAPDAWVQGILEGKSWIIQNDLLVEVAVADLQKKLDRRGSKDLVKNLKEFIKAIR